jgi:hypothetical protein
MIKVEQLNSNGDPTGEPASFFKFVEEGMRWSEAQRGAKLEWGEEGRFFSLEGMTKDEVEALGTEGDYPPVRYWITGVEEDGEIRELEESDFEDEDSVILSRN